MKSSSVQPAFWAQKENIKYKGYFYLLITSFIPGAGGGGGDVFLSEISQ